MTVRSCKCGRPIPANARSTRKWCSERCRKYDWARRNRRRCVDCGALTSTSRTTRCWDCELRRRDVLRLERWAVIKALWDAGLPMAKMATFPETGRANANALGVELDRMKKAGVDLPVRRAGWLGGYKMGGPPRKPVTDHRGASQRLASAIRAGVIARPDTCERCGTQGNVEGHHHDYSKPLDVEWLCRTCHAEIHAAERRIAA
jgi:hypothetical protein